jgi:hypothetical protein
VPQNKNKKDDVAIKANNKRAISKLDTRKTNKKQ